MPPKRRRPRVGPFWRGGLPRIISHRGLARDVPENALAAFRAALDAGATHLESDVRATRDGVAVLCHDAHLETYGISGITVSELTLAELQSIDLGGGERVLTLAQALTSLPTARFNIDVKVAEAVWPTVEAIRQADGRDRVLIASFSERRRRTAATLLPGIATSASALSAAVAILAAKVGVQWLVARMVRNVDALQIPMKWGLSTVTPRVLRALHEAGVEVHIWTVNDEQTMRSLLAAGVDGIITDRVDVAVALVARGL